MSRTTEHDDASSKDIVAYQVDPLVRRSLQGRLFEQIQQAWRVADLAGLRRSNWSTHDNRDMILRQRIEGLDDGTLLQLWDGQRPQSREPQRVMDDLMEFVKVQSLTCGQIQLHVPGFMLQPATSALPRT